MTRPSRDWLGYSNLPPESERYQRIERILSSADFKHLEKRGIDLRRRYQPNLSPDVSCGINPACFTSGFDNLVVELAFSDSVCWIARIPHRTVDNTRTALLSEIATLSILRQRTSIPVPRVFHFEMSADQQFGHPYVLMECLEGRTVDNGLARSIPPQFHAKVAEQLAKVFVELQGLAFDRIGRLWCGESVDQPVEIIAMAWHESPGPLETSLEYFYNQRQGENRQIIAMHPNDPDWLTACWVLKTALAQIIIEDRVRGPFPLCHLDLHYGNLLFDDEYNLTGIIDWSSAQAAPLEQLAVCPELVTFPGLSEEENRPIVEFKNLVVQFIKGMEEEKMPPADRPPASVSPGLDRRSLSTYMASKSAEITLRQYMASPQGSLFAGEAVAELMYGRHVTWEQLREVYGTMPPL